MEKIQEISSISCQQHLYLVETNSSTFSHFTNHNQFQNNKLSAELINIYVIPINEADLLLWKSIIKPIQMRIDPALCLSVYEKPNPIFNVTGCKLKGYMHPSAPRCQNSYLKWICENAQMSIDELKPNHFILPEADHSTTNIPPKPWLIRVTNSYVSMCGQIYSRCGLIHTTANCMANQQKPLIEMIKNRCPKHSIVSKIRTDLTSLELESNTRNINISCPYSASSTIINNRSNKIKSLATVSFFDKVFVVAEADDTYVYHIHIEIMPRIIYHLEFLSQNPDIQILIGCDSKKDPIKTENGLQAGLRAMKPYMDLIGLSMDRLIVHKHVFAKE
eukprot:gene10576-14206_t